LESDTKENHPTTSGCRPYSKRPSGDAQIPDFAISTLEKSISRKIFCISWIFLFLKWMLDKYDVDFFEIDMNLEI